MKVIGHERGGRRGGEGGGDEERERLLDEMGGERATLRRLAPLRHERVGIDVAGGEPRLHHRDQRGDCSK